MNVTKRNGSKEQVSFDKVTNRLRILCEMEPKLSKVNYIDISQKVVSRIYVVFIHTDQMILLLSYLHKWE